MILKMADEKSSYGAKRANLSRGGAWMACWTVMTFSWLAESIRAARQVLRVLCMHWLTVPCFSHEYSAFLCCVLPDAGRQQRAWDWRQDCSHLDCKRHTGTSKSFKFSTSVIIGIILFEMYERIIDWSHECLRPSFVELMDRGLSHNSR